MIQLNDILHYYMGVEMMYASHHEPQNATYVLKHQNISEAIQFGDRPILRMIRDISKEEEKTYHSICGEGTDGVHVVVVRFDTPESFHYLIKQGFDVFELIESNQAIDAKTISNGQIPQSKQ